MVSLSDSLVSSSARKISLRKRPDLSAKRQHYLGRSYWVVKEPVGLNYYRFQDEEYAILQMLDGTRSLDEIKEQFEAEFPPQKITLEELQQFLGMLHRSGLVVASVPGQGKELRKRRDERRRKEILGAMSNILCIRFKGFDPERLLNWLYPKLRWIFSPIVLGFFVLLAFAALTLVLVQFDEFRSKLPAFHQFFSPTNALWLAVVLAATKVCHEFGHGLTCKHFNGECHEMGVMILVLTPCLYCNVSDSWMLPNKWHRAAIGAAGIFVEIGLAAICTFIWWFTEPGLLNHLCLNVMFISSVSTILFNANPLLRYDGYYILSDVAEIPNLRQKATSILSRKMGQLLLGLEPPEDPFLPQRNQIFFAMYSVAAAVYRWFVLASILYFLYKVFEPYRLEIIGKAIVAMSLYGLIVMPLYKLGKFFYVPGRWDKVKKPRMYASIAVVAALIAGVLLIPLPHSIICTLEVQPEDAATVYVDVAGTLDEIDVDPGQHVSKNTRLAKLTNHDVELELLKLSGSRDQMLREIESLQRQRYHDDQAGAQIPATREALAAVEDQRREKQADLQRLELLAPAEGVVFPPPRKPSQEDPNGQLAGWSGTPLDEQNLGAFLEAGSLFCQIGDPKQMEAILIIDQGDLEFVATGQNVEIKLDELPHETLHGAITEIANVELEVSPTRLSVKSGGELPTKTDASGVERPMSTSYQARVPLNNTEGLLRPGLRGRAKVHTGWQTLGARFWRLVTQTINFRL